MLLPSPLLALCHSVSQSQITKDNVSVQMHRFLHCCFCTPKTLNVCFFLKKKSTTRTTKKKKKNCKKCIKNFSALIFFFYRCQPSGMSTNAPKKVSWIGDNGSSRRRTKCQHCSEDNCETCWAWNAPSWVGARDPRRGRPPVSLVQLARQTFLCLAWLQMRQSKARMPSSPSQNRLWCLVDVAALS